MKIKALDSTALHRYHPALIIYNKIHRQFRNHFFNQSMLKKWFFWRRMRCDQEVCVQVRVVGIKCCKYFMECIDIALFVK